MKSNREEAVHRSSSIAGISRTRATVLLGVLAAGVAACAPEATAPDWGPVVSAEWLSDRLQDSTLVLLHVGGREGFEQEHIPGARFADVAELAVRSDSATGLRNEVPGPDVLRDRLEALGISDLSRVVVYSADERVLWATRVLFTLDQAGLGGRAALLDGGLLQWKREGHPVTSEVGAAKRGSFTAAPTRDLVVDAAWVAANASRSGYVLLDARSAAQFSGREESVGVRPGHIPGAGNLPLTELFDGAGRIRHPAELERVFRAAGAMPGDTVVAYCFTGVLGTGVTLAAKTLGYEALLYDGSYEEWGADPQRPVETGSGG